MREERGREREESRAKDCTEIVPLWPEMKRQSGLHSLIIRKSSLVVYTRSRAIVGVRE